MYLVFFDIDDTLIKGQSQKYLINYLLRRGLIKFNFFLEIYFWFLLYKIGLVNNVIYISEKSYIMCKGWSKKYMDEIIDDFFNSVIKSKFYKKSLELIEYHRCHGGKIVLISSSLYPIASCIGKFLNVDSVIATKLALFNNVYTGLVDGYVIYGENKVTAVNKFISDNNFSLLGSYAYSDHVSDFSFMKLIDNPIVINPSKKLFNISVRYKWGVEYVK